MHRGNGACLAWGKKSSVGPSDSYTASEGRSLLMSTRKSLSRWFRLFSMMHERTRDHWHRLEQVCTYGDTFFTMKTVRQCSQSPFLLDFKNRLGKTQDRLVWNL